MNLLILLCEIIPSSDGHLPVRAAYNFYGNSFLTNEERYRRNMTQIQIVRDAITNLNLLFMHMFRDCEVEMEFWKLIDGK